MDAVRTPPLTPGQPGWSYRFEWQYFADWCAAMGLDPLPATPLTLAQFLDVDDAARATRRRRVAAVNCIHQLVGEVRPGTATAVRRILSARADYSWQAKEVIAGIPVTGWPTAVFGRRDALLLWLVCVARLPLTAVPDLRRSDLTSDGQVVHVGGGHDVAVAVNADDPFGLLPVWARWAAVQTRLDRHRSPKALAAPLMKAPPVDTDSAPQLSVPPPPPQDGPLFPPVDRWGYQPLSNTTTAGMTTTSARRVIRSRIEGSRPEHKAPQWVTATLAEPAVPEEPTPPVLADIHSQAVAARQSGLEQLSGLDDTFVDIDRRAAELLARTEQLLADLNLD